MTKFVETAPRSVAGGMSHIVRGIGNRGIVFEAPNDQGAPDPDAEARLAAAAEKAAAEKAAAEKAEAEKAAADEAERKRQEEEDKADPEKAKLLREVMDKKSKLKETEAKAERLEAELKKFEGLDLEKIKGLLDAEKTREEQELEQKGEWERLKKMMREDNERAIKEREEKIEALTKAEREYQAKIDRLTIGNDFSSSSFIKEELVLTPTKARALYGEYFEVEGDRTVAYDKPKGSANRTMLVDGSGEPLSFDAAMKKIIEADPDKDTLIRAKMKPGGGSKSQENKGSGQEKSSDKLYGVSRIAASFAS